MAVSRPTADLKQKSGLFKCQLVTWVVKATELLVYDVFDFNISKLVLRIRLHFFKTVCVTFFVRDVLANK